jgi:hypothetical protein
MGLNEYGYVFIRRVTTRFSVIKFSERIQYLLGIWECATIESGRYKNRKKYTGKEFPFPLKEDVPECITDIFEKHIETQNLQYTNSTSPMNTYNEATLIDEPYDPEIQPELVKEAKNIKLYSYSGNLFCRKGDQYLMKAGETLWKSKKDKSEVVCPRDMSVMWDFFNVFKKIGLFLRQILLEKSC